MMPTPVFVSYSHRDSFWKDRLVEAIRANNHPGELDLWDDTRLRGGDLWREHIEHAIAASRIAVLLLSDNFLESPFIRDEELPKMFQSRIASGTRLVPVILSDLASAPSWLNAFQRLPTHTTLHSDPNAVEGVAKEILSLTRMQALPYLPFPGTAVPRSFSFAPVTMIGLRLNRDNPFRLEFMFDPGEAGPESRSFRSEAERLIRYFLFGLSIPESNIWVNLSPQEPGRVISPDLQKTELGRDLLAQDYLLKQFNASSIHPDCSTGERYWSAVHERAQLYGNDTASNAFSRVWIVPKVAEVTEQDSVVVVTRAHLGAELRTDDDAAYAGSGCDRFGANRGESEAQRDLRNWASGVFAQVLLPELEAELNDGRHFAITRQAFNALILARWFKLKVNDTILRETVCPELVPKMLVEDDFAGAVYKQYLESYNLGVMNYIREDTDPVTQQTIPRRYFSGGYILRALKDLLAVDSSPVSLERCVPKSRVPLWVDTEFVSVDGGFDSGPGHDEGTDPGGIDLDLSHSGRIRTVNAGSDPVFHFSPEGTTELIRRQGRAVVPIIRDIRRVSGL